MDKKNNIERLAVLENQMQNVSKKIDAVDLSISALHSKVDTLVTTFHENFVSKGEFEQWKKSRNLERITMVLVTAIITALVTFFIASIKLS